MKLTAQIVDRLPIQTGISKTGNPWSKSTLIVETIEQYPRKVAISNMKKADEFAGLDTGIYDFDISVESREFNGRWYTEVSCWNWTLAQQQYDS